MYIISEQPTGEVRVKARLCLIPLWLVCVILGGVYIDQDDAPLSVGIWLLVVGLISIASASGQAFAYYTYLPKDWAVIVRSIANAVGLTWFSVGGPTLFRWNIDQSGNFIWTWSTVVWAAVGFKYLIRMIDTYVATMANCNARDPATPMSYNVPQKRAFDAHIPSFITYALVLVGVSVSHLTVAGIAFEPGWLSISAWLIGCAVLCLAWVPIYGFVTLYEEYGDVYAVLELIRIYLHLIWIAIFGSIAIFGDLDKYDTPAWGYAIGVWGALLYLYLIDVINGMMACIGYWLIIPENGERPGVMGK